MWGLTSGSLCPEALGWEAEREPGNTRCNVSAPPETEDCSLPTQSRVPAGLESSSEVPIWFTKKGIDFVAQHAVLVQLTEAADLARGWGDPGCLVGSWLPRAHVRCRQAQWPVFLSSKSLLICILPDMVMSHGSFGFLFIHVCVLRGCAIAKGFMAS